INQEVDRLRHAATAAVFARRDVIVVASVSAIFGLGSPETYDMNMQVLKTGEFVHRDKLLRKHVSIHYARNDTALGPATFRVPDDFMVFLDESHQTVPQLGGMYEGDRSRKQTLVDYGFRLPSALDNRPQKFDEFMSITPQLLFVSATPGEFERSHSSKVVEQI